MMTREEAIEIFEQKGWWIAQKETLTFKQAEEIIKLNDAVNFALAALRPVGRDRVEKVWKGEWIQDKNGQVNCSRCGSVCAVGGENALHNAKEFELFCSCCGDAKTDDAVQMVMERMEEIKNG